MILIGASGHAKVIIDTLEKMGEEVSFLLDANPMIKELQGYEVKYDKEHSFDLEEEYLLSIGANMIRKRLAERNELTYGWAIHPSAILADDVSIGQGTVVMAGTVVNSSTQIGNHCIINTSSSIDHDCLLGDYVHISPNATLCGTVKVGEGTHIGAGASIIPNITIGEWANIGAGAVVIRDVPDGATVVGNPAKVIKIKND